MKVCPKCHRRHSGICGIPAIGVRIGMGGIGITRKQSTIASLIHTKPKSARKGVNTLKRLLLEARAQEKKISDMMKILPTEMPEFDKLMDRLGKIETMILQLNRQIIERESK